MRSLMQKFTLLLFVVMSSVNLIYAQNSNQCPPRIAMVTPEFVAIANQPQKIHFTIIGVCLEDKKIFLADEADNSKKFQVDGKVSEAGRVFMGDAKIDRPGTYIVHLVPTTVV